MPSTAEVLTASMRGAIPNAHDTEQEVNVMLADAVRDIVTVYPNCVAADAAHGSYRTFDKLSYTTTMTTHSEYLGVGFNVFKLDMLAFAPLGFRLTTQDIELHGNKYYPIETGFTADG